MAGVDREIYEFEGFRLDVTERRLDHLEEPGLTNLPEKAFQTLVYLVRRAGSLVEKDELLAAIWPDSVVEEGNLGKAIHSIRQVLGRRSGTRFIETIPKHGYRLVVPVRLVSDASHPRRDGDGRAVPEGQASGDASAKVVSPEAAYARVRPARHGSITVALAAVILLAGAAMLWFRLPADPNDNSGEPDSERSQAYDLFVRGKIKINNENLEDTRAGVALLEEAVTADPKLAEAFAHLARGYNTLAFKYSEGAERRRFHENAEVAIEKALELDPDLAQAHFARGLILWSNSEGFPHELAIQSYKRSLELDPRSDETHHQLSLVFSHIGLLDDADESVRRALELNPNNTLARFRTGVYLQYRGKFEDAIDSFKSIPREHTPLLMDRSLAESLIQADRKDEASAIVESHLQRFPNDEGGSFTSVKALIAAKEGKWQEAERLALHAEQIGYDFGHFHHTAHNIAAVYAQLEQPDRAVAWLERAAEEGFPNYPYFSIDPNLAKIRAHPSFIAFMSELQKRWEKFKSLSRS